LLQAKMKSGVT